MQPHIIQFAKAPVLGEVKTRLTPHLSESESLSLHCTLVGHTVSTMMAISDSTLELWLTSNHNFKDFSLVYSLEELAVYVQRGTSLGERLCNAISECLTRTNMFAVIGSDCPFIDENYIHKTWQALVDHDLVLGPATDGGYVLLAARQCYPELFDDIEWGSEKVFVQTFDKAKKLGLKCHCLEPLNDIDRPEDLKLIEGLLTL